MTDCHILSSPLPKNIKELRGGRNNLVILADSGSAKSVIKSFSRTHQREGKFARETAFLVFCQKLGLAPVPKVVNHCIEHGVLETTYEAGTTRELFERLDVSQLIDFLHLINGDQAIKAGGFEFEALENVDSILKFQQTINLRRGQLGRVTGSKMKGKLNEIKSAISMSENYLGSQEYIRDLGKLDLLIESTRSTVSGQRFLSPSDFGSHNTLKKDGNLIFIDFEYSGYDSGVNLLGDAITQPDTRWAEGARPLFASRFMTELFGINLHSLDELDRLFTLRWILVMVIRALRDCDESENMETVTALNLYAESSSLAIYGK